TARTLLAAASEEYGILSFRVKDVVCITYSMKERGATMLIASIRTTVTIIEACGRGCAPACIPEEDKICLRRRGDLALTRFI
ncbi:MAG TPA: hypothetical protein VF458_07555, partial [Ktedonobacteraceae bacterium]